MIQITQLLWVMSLLSTTNCSVYVNSYAQEGTEAVMTEEICQLHK